MCSLRGRDTLPEYDERRFHRGLISCRSHRHNLDECSSRLLAERPDAPSGLLFVKSEQEGKLRPEDGVRLTLNSTLMTVDEAWTAAATEPLPLAGPARVSMAANRRHDSDPESATDYVTKDVFATSGEMGPLDELSRAASQRRL